MLDLYTGWSLMLTYLVHSTICLGAVWCLFRWVKGNSPSLRETVWKFATIAPLLTATVQTFFLPNSWTIPVVFSEPASIIETPKQKIDLGELDRYLDELETELKQPKQELLSQSPKNELEVERLSAISQSPEVPKNLSKGKPTTLGLPKTETTNLDNEGQLSKKSKVATLTPSFNYGQIVWLLGSLFVVVVAAGLVRLFKNFGQLNWALQNAIPLHEGPIAESLNRLTTKFRIRKPVRLFQLEQISEPAASGWVNWCILLPVGIEKQLSEDELEAALSHELAHLVRHDVWWLWIGRGLTWMCPFQPLNRIAHREWHQAAESLCDLWAIEQGVSRFSLARSLTTVATWVSQERVAFSMSVTGSGGEHLTTRVENLLDEQEDRYRSKWKRISVLGGGCCVLAVLLSWIPQIEIRAHEQAAKPILKKESASSGSRKLQPFHEHYLKNVNHEATLLQKEMEELVPLSKQHSVEVQQRTNKMNQQANAIQHQLNELQLRLKEALPEE